MDSKDPKEGITVSLHGKTIDTLDFACETFDFENRSVFVERAIKHYIAHKIAANPLFWNEIYKKFIAKS